MILRIFRQMRIDALASERVRKYLLYAAGELFLVIVGILIALQINNWNEARVAQDEIRGHALAVAAAIERDMQMLVPVEIQIRTSIRQSEEMARYLRDRPVAEIRNADLYFLSTHIGYRPYAWNRAELEQLKAAGGLRMMRNRTLAARISDYDALAQHLDQDYREDEASARSLLGAMQRLVDFNYDPEGLLAVLEWPDGYALEEVERRLTRYRETDEYVRLDALDRMPLSTEAAEFRQLANLNMAYANSTAARPDIELPRLRSYAAEIQALIAAEYP